MMWQTYNAVHLRVFKEQLNTTEQLFGPAISTSTAAARAKAKPSEVLFTGDSGIPAVTGDGSQEPVDNPPVMPAIPSPPTSQPPPN